MFKSLQDFFTNQINKSQNKTAPDQLDIKLASATLMFELIRSDGHIDDIETQTMRDILQQQFDLSEQDIDSLFALAHQTSDQAVSLHAFTRQLCEHWNAEQREQLIENLWVLALADSMIDAHERHLVRKVAGLLYLNDTQIAKTRERAKQRLQSQN